jgi:hypothetical protein
VVVLVPVKSGGDAIVSGGGQLSLRLLSFSGSICGW